MTRYTSPMTETPIFPPTMLRESSSSLSPRTRGSRSWKAVTGLGERCHISDASFCVRASYWQSLAQNLGFLLGCRESHLGRMPQNRGQKDKESFPHRSYRLRFNLLPFVAKDQAAIAMQACQKSGNLQDAASFPCID